MNTAQFTHFVAETPGLGSSTVEGLSAGPRSLTRAGWKPQLRYASLAVIALLLVGLALSVHNSIRDIQAEIDVINAMLGPNCF